MTEVFWFVLTGDVGGVVSKGVGVRVRSSSLKFGRLDGGLVLGADGEPVILDGTGVRLLVA